MKNKISICLATYNGEKYLKEQLDSLVNQTISPYEVIVQDDCSTDNTVGIARQYMDKLNLKIYLNEINLGFTKNFESVLQKATGDLIAPCDQDDIWKSDKLEKLSGLIGEHSLIYADSLLVNSEAESLHQSLSQKLKNNFIDSQSALHYIFDNSVSAHSMLFKKELLEYIFPFPSITYFDAYIGAVAASLDGVVFLDESLVLYRQHNTNTLAKKKKQKLSLFAKIKTKLQKKYDANQRLVAQVDEFLSIQTINQKDHQILVELKSHLELFEKCWFNFRLFNLYFANKNKFFAISTRNKFVMALKKSIGYKLYKVAPFL